MALQCCYCTKFVGNKRVVFTPYGGSFDFEPPGERNLCEKCWNGLTEKQKQELNDLSWIKPKIIGFGEG